MNWWDFSDTADSDAESVASRLQDTDTERLTDGVLALLSRLGRSEAVATMMSMSNPASMQVSFVRTQGNRLTLWLHNPSPRSISFFGTLSCVLLTHVNGKHANIIVGSIIREPTLVNGRYLVLVEAGRKLLRAEARRTYRIPVIPEAGLQAVVRGPGNHRVALSTQDISQGGMGGELLNCPASAFRLGAPVQVALRCGEHQVWLDAHVRFRRGNMIGLFFPEVWRHNELEAPPELRAIVRTVERAWVRRQAAERAV